MRIKFTYMHIDTILGERFKGEAISVPQGVGDSLQTAFSNLGEVGSVLPKVNIMALTATAIKETRKATCKSLGEPWHCLKSPNMPNK